MLYLILFLYQTTTVADAVHLLLGCILFCSYIKPQPLPRNTLKQQSCILFCSYIKPQLATMSSPSPLVVSYSVPISNHNLLLHLIHLFQVVSYSVPISNHNSWL